MSDSASAPARRPKPSWPLYLAAALSFVPVLGFFLGSIAVTWGLVSSRPGARRAVVIAGAGALLNIVGIFVIGALANRRPEVREAGILRIRENLGAIVVALEEQHALTHHYPRSLAAMNQARGVLHLLPIMETGPGLFQLRFTRNFQYILAADGLSYDLFSVGPDDKPGTNDDIRPLMPDSLVGKSGLRAQ